MTEVPNLPVPSPLLGPPDPNNPAYNIENTERLDLPEIPLSEDESGRNSSDRSLLLEHYRKSTTPPQWNRYVLLGYFSHDSGDSLDNDWHHDTINWLTRHRIVWYTFFYLVERKIDIPLTLQSWAANSGLSSIFVCP